MDTTDNSIIKRLTMDKKSVNMAKYRKPDLTLTSEQWKTCWRVKRDSCSMKNFAARLIMELFDPKDLFMRNCNGKAGKQKISEEYLNIILYACHSMYGEEMADDSEKAW